MSLLRAWRHPRPEGAAGRCIGAGTDLPVERRRAKRLARRVQQLARRDRLPHVACCSPLRRSADVGRWLKRWGWRIHLDPALREIDFGAWDGQPWSTIPQAEIDAWITAFHEHSPGGGESLRQLFARVAAWKPPEGGRAALVIGHGGWMLARRWLAERGQDLPEAADWPAPPAYGALWLI